MSIIAHKQIKKTGLSEAYLEIKQRIDQLEGENEALRNMLNSNDEEFEKLYTENKKLKAALKKLEKENEKLKNPPIWKNDGEL